MNEDTETLKKISSAPSRRHTHGGQLRLTQFLVREALQTINRRPNGFFRPSARVESALATQRIATYLVHDG